MEAGFEEKQKKLLSLELLLKICMAVLWLASVSLLICPSLSCYICFIKPQVSARLCSGYVVGETNVNSVDECFRMLDRIFNTNKKVTEAGRAGRGQAVICLLIPAKQRCDVFPLSSWRFRRQAEGDPRSRDLTHSDRVSGKADYG